MRMFSIVILSLSAHTSQCTRDERITRGVACKGRKTVIGATEVAAVEATD